MKILYLFKGGRKKRLESVISSEAPTEFLYGFPYFKEKGYLTDIIEQNELTQNTNTFQYKILEKQRNFISKSLNIGMDTPFLFNIIDQLNSYDVIMAIPDSVGLALSYYKKKGWLSSRIVFFEMGLASRMYQLKNKSILKYSFFKYYINHLLKYCDRMVVLGMGEQNFLSHEFPNIKNRNFLIPFGVDINFWR
ncbi:MAG: hypothetical protein C4550_03005, partial [Nitrospiraceae bacterium]